MRKICIYFDEAECEFKHKRGCEGCFWYREQKDFSDIFKEAVEKNENLKKEEI